MRGTDIRSMVWMDARTLRVAGLDPGQGSGRVVCLQELQAALKERGLTLAEVTRRLNEPAPRFKRSGIL